MKALNHGTSRGRWAAYQAAITTNQNQGMSLMSKVGSWLRALVNGVLQNIVADILLIVAIPILSLVYALYTNNPQIVLLIVLIVLATINILIGFSLFRQQRLVSKSLQELDRIKQLFPLPDEDYNPLEHQVRDEFEITDKRFDESSTPQKIIVRFTNRGNNVIRVMKITFSDKSLHESALIQSYRKDSKGRFLIPFDPNKAEVLPEQQFPVEICLQQTWKSEDIYKLAGNWGYLRLSVVYKGEEVEVFEGI